MSALDERLPARSHGQELEWPRWVPLFAAALPLALAVEVVIQRSYGRAQVGPDGLGPMDVSTILLVGLVVLPWLLDALVALVPWLERLPGLYLPRTVFAAMVIGGATGLILNPVEYDFNPFFLVLLSAQSACVMRRWGGALVALACVGVMAGIELAGRFDGSMLWIFGIVFAWFGGVMIRSQMVLTARLKATQAELAQKAADDERHRIAREIHDVIAHSLTVTMLHVTGARLALRRDPEDAEEALAEAERLGRQSLQDIRRTVGLLGPEADGTGAPAPGVDDLERLVADYASAGVDVELRTDGDVAAIPEAAGLGLYRVVQESLTNVAKHAPGARTEVTLRVDGDRLELDVCNDPGAGPAPAVENGGLGLKGMRERAQALGGELRAGPDGSGWRVELTAPLRGNPE